MNDLALNGGRFEGSLTRSLAVVYEDRLFRFQPSFDQKAFVVGLRQCTGAKKYSLLE